MVVSVTPVEEKEPAVVEINEKDMSPRRKPVIQKKTLLKHPEPKKEPPKKLPKAQLPKFEYEPVKEPVKEPEPPKVEEIKKPEPVE